MYKFKLLCLAFTILSSCGVYTFTGADVHPDAKTISVKYFQNQASLVQPLLSQILTDGLQDYLIQQTNLNLIRSNGDLQFEGYISDYQIKPISISANDVANQNRLIISVFVRFTNEIEPDKSYEQTFSRYADFDSNLNISQIEESLMLEITTELIEDLFNKAVVNW